MFIFPEITNIHTGTCGDPFDKAHHGMMHVHCSDTSWLAKDFYFYRGSYLRMLCKFSKQNKNLNKDLPNYLKRPTNAKESPPC